MKKKVSFRMKIYVKNVYGLLEGWGIYVFYFILVIFWSGVGYGEELKGNVIFDLIIFLLEIFI